jgi:hypothetical protein
MCEINWSAISIVIATIAGPILAVWASEWRQQKRQIHDRKEWVFRSLWSTRSVTLHHDHVQALNHIDFAFPEKDYPEISDAWHLYFAHLNTDQGQTEDSLARWNEKASNLLADLILLMASDLNIPFSKSLVKQPSYYPKGYAFTEYQQNELRTLLLEVLKNGRPINIRHIVDTPPGKDKTS